MKKLFLLSLSSISYAIIHSQNVGIGTTTPSEKLHINGNIKVDTLKPNALKLTINAGLNKVLTSDASGNASWTESSSSSAGAAAGNIGYGVWGDCATNGNISEYQPVGISPEDPHSLGFSVAISGKFAFVSASNEELELSFQPEAVYVYHHNGTEWVQAQRLIHSTQGIEKRFGNSVSISGNYAVIGCPFDSVGNNRGQGSAYVYMYNGISWNLIQQLTDPVGSSADYFGSCVSISAKYIIVGAKGDDIGANTDQGSAIIFELNGNSWQYQQKLVASTGASGDGFGASVSISGAYAIVGAPSDDNELKEYAGSISIFWYSGTSWVQRRKINGEYSNRRLGQSVSIDGNCAVVGQPGDNSGGRANVYCNTGTNWSAYSSKFISSASVNGKRFGETVSISGDYILVGDPYEEGIELNEGSVTLFIKVGNNWQQLQYIKNPAGGGSDVRMGSSLAFDGSTKRFVIGGPNAFGRDGTAMFGKVN